MLATYFSTERKKQIFFFDQSKEGEEQDNHQLSYCLGISVQMKPKQPNGV